MGVDAPSTRKQSPNRAIYFLSFFIFKNASRVKHKNDGDVTLDKRGKEIKKKNESGQLFLCHLYVEKAVAVKMFAVDWR